MSSGDQDLQTARGLHQQGRLPEALASGNPPDLIALMGSQA